MTARSVATVGTTPASDNAVSLYLIGVFLICFLGNVSSGLVSTIASVYLPIITSEMSGVGAESQAGLSTYINALYLIGWASGGLLWGMISDRIGRARALSLCLAAVGILTLSVSFASTWWMVVSLRLAGGLAVGGILVITMTFLSEIWPRSSRSMIMGIASIGFPVGIFSSGLINTLVSDWREAFWIGAGPIALALIVMTFVRESSAWISARERIRVTSKNGSFFQIPGLVHGAVVCGTMLIVLWSIFSWMPTWVQSILVSGDGQRERGMVMMLLGVGGVVGGACSGWIAKAIGERKTMLICFSGAFCMAFILFGVISEFSSVVYLATAVLSFFFGMSQGLLSFYIPQFFEVHVRASATGFCFNAGRLVTAFAVFALGMLVTFFGGYGNSLLFFSGLLVPGFLFVLISKPYQPKTKS